MPTLPSRDGTRCRPLPAPSVFPGKPRRWPRSRHPRRPPNPPPLLSPPLGSAGNHGAAKGDATHTRVRGRAGRIQTRWSATPLSVLCVVPRAQRPRAVQSGRMEVVVSAQSGAGRVPTTRPTRCATTFALYRRAPLALSHFFEHLARHDVSSPFARRLRPPPPRAAARRGRGAHTHTPPRRTTDKG